MTMTRSTRPTTSRMPAVVITKGSLSTKRAALPLTTATRGPKVARGRMVEVIAGRGRDQDGMEGGDDVGGGERQRHQGFAPVVVGVLDRRPRADVVEHRVDERAPPAKLEDQRRVADEGQ